MHSSDSRNFRFHLPHRRHLLALAVLLSSAAVAADPAPTAAEELIVTGTRLAADEAVLPNATTVLDRFDIEARNPAVASDLLRDVPGLHVNQPGAGGVTQIFIRGSEPNFTVFMLDGIKVNDPNNTRGGSFDLASLNLANIERVEIVRGPQSSIYGSDGLAGVINFISQPGGDHLSANVEVEAGGDEFRRGTIQAGGPVGRDVRFSLQATSRDDGEAVPGSTYEADTVSGRLRITPADNMVANVYARYASMDSSSFPEQSGGPDLAVLRTLDHAEADDYSLGTDLDWTLNDVWSVQAVASLYDRSDEYASPGISPGDQVPPNGAANELDRYNAALRTTVRPGNRLVATFGVDFQRESGDSEGYVDFGPGIRIPNDFALDRDIVGVFAEGRYLVGDQLVLQGSIRHDDPDEVSGETTGKLGAVYTLGNGTTRLRANWGSGFKLPSFFALGSPLVGEPTLKPETSRSVELGVTQTLLDGAAEVGVTVFDNDYRNLIDFDPDTFKNVNRDAVTTRGAEFSGQWALSSTLALRGQATWTDIDVKHTDRELLQRPDWRGGAGLRWTPTERWLLDLNWLYVGDVLDSSIPTGILTLNAWNRVDANASWVVTPRLKLTLAVDNLLDSNYQEAVGFPAAGIRPRLGVRYLFGALP
ncbi:MAG: TonB-dependent receptor [Gammaproteobacteria bacterium]